MSSSTPERAGRWIMGLVMAVGGLFACDSAGQHGSVGETSGSDPVPDVAERSWEDGERGAEELDPSLGPDSTEETVEDPAAPYLPIPTGPLGGERPAKVTLPDDYDPAVPWPLVMLLHGYSVDGFLQDYYLGVGELVDERDFIFILPDGLKDSSGAGFWNAAPGCCDWEGSGVDDLGYLVGLVEEARTKYHVDDARVVLMGHSNGGYMSHQLACDRADVFTAIASIAGTSYAFMDTQCEATEPVSVLQIHGTLDTTVSYDAPFAGVGAQETSQWWAERNGCAEGVALDGRDYDAAVFGSETEPTSWTGCEAGVAVELWKMVATSHIPVFQEGFASDVLDFLLGHPRP